VLLLVFTSLRDQAFRLIVQVSPNPVQEGTVISHGDTDLGATLHSRPRLAANNGRNMSQNQIDDAIGDSTRIGIKHDRLLSVKLLDYENLLPRMRFNCRKPCTNGDQGINGIKISL
jgi:hypothetical protein